MIKRLGLAGLTLTLLTGGAFADTQQTIAFWNGNKTQVRQVYERKLLDAVLNATVKAHGPFAVSENTETLTNREESDVFTDQNTDVFVTVAGNPKLRNKDKIVVAQPLMKGLLGHRLLIVRKQDLPRFDNIQTEAAFKQLSIGIPDGWADAELFRHNGYNVVEGGTFDEIFDLLAAKKFDYVALGANEIEQAFESRAEKYEMFSIEPTTLLYYPFALVFYVNPEKPALAERLREGLEAVEQSGEAQRLFDEATGNLIERLNLTDRKVFHLQNPMLPETLQKYRSPLLNEPD
ncbi:amino acid ABC transporter substrate-binding protein [Salinimonas sp. HHU 13199]|uniref:Amino acid ABC transporter substrate-binding protein n=2 Tax=Salinimonas profundi TaxID=2729140 RepID=A0ABR8LGE9_9ALTE|nr:amino acid ABC transporter substrate-binding protein [Salinimonas profundi]